MRLRLLLRLVSLHGVALLLVSGKAISFHAGLTAASRVNACRLVSSLKDGGAPVQLLGIRGGDGGLRHLLPKLDRDFAARVADAFIMLQASYSWLAPEGACHMYGLNVSTLNVSVNRKLASAYLGSAVMMYGLLFQKCSQNTAFAGVSIVWMVEQVKCMFNKEPQQIGHAVEREYVILVLATLAARATLSNACWAPLAIKFIALFQLINGIPFAFAPLTTCQFWKVPIGMPTSGNQQQLQQQTKNFIQSVFLHRFMGVGLVFSGIHQVSVAFGMDVYKAFGLAFGWLFCVNLKAFLQSPDFKDLARPSSPAGPNHRKRIPLRGLFFPMFNASVAASLLVGGTASGND